jgi:hypothetical protein
MSRGNPPRKAFIHTQSSQAESKLSQAHAIIAHQESNGLMKCYMGIMPLGLLKRLSNEGGGVMIS